MKLREPRIDHIAREIVNILEEEGFIEVSDKSAAYSAVFNMILDDLELEEQLDVEVREILEQYSDKMDQDRIQYHEMFKMVKKQLAKERNLIL